MDLSSNRSQNEDRVMQRQLYRAGQTQPAPKTPTPVSTPSKSSSSAAAKPKRSPSSSSNRRKKALIALGLAVWLFLLGSVSYCLCLPNLAQMNRERRAIFEDKSLTWDQKIEKFREMDAKLTPEQRRQMREISWKERIREGNKKMYNFLSLSPQEQMAQLRQEAAERERWRQEWMKNRKNAPPRGNRGGGNANGGAGNKGGGGGGRGGPGGGPGGGGGGPTRSATSFLDMGSSPESRAGSYYKRGLSAQMGLGGGGRGGPGRGP